MARRGATLRIGRLAGVPIGIHPLWLVIVALITLALGSDYFPTEAPGVSDPVAYLLGLGSALALFVGILLHELGHAIVARRHGVEIEEIDLWLLGGVARMTGEPHEPGDELRFALAGPAVTCVLLAGFGALRLIVGDSSDAVRAFLDYQLYINAAVVLFNLLPAFPLDGGRAVRALLWRRFGDRERATALAAQGGKTFGFMLVALGVISFAAGAIGGLWLGLVGGFLIVAAGAEAQRTALEQEFAGRTAAMLMTAPAVSLAADLPLDDAIVVGFSRHLYSAFPVTDADGRAIGVLTIDAVRQVPAPLRAQRRVEDVAALDRSLLVTPETAVTELLARPSYLHIGRAVVVDADERPVGVVSVTDVQRRLRADALLPSTPPSAG